jgi:hypothetical protein
MPGVRPDSSGTHAVRCGGPCRRPRRRGRVVLRPNPSLESLIPTVADAARLSLRTAAPWPEPGHVPVCPLDASVRVEKPSRRGWGERRRADLETFRLILAPAPGRGNRADPGRRRQPDITRRWLTARADRIVTTNRNGRPVRRPAVPDKGMDGKSLLKQRQRESNNYAINPRETVTLLCWPQMLVRQCTRRQLSSKRPPCSGVSDKKHPLRGANGALRYDAS